MLHEFRCHVQWCAQHKVQAFFFVEFLSKSQISNFYIKLIFILFNKQYILWLEITMSDWLQMHIIKSQHDLTDNVGRLALSETVEFGQPIKKLTSFHNFWNDVVVFIVFN